MMHRFVNHRRKWKWKKHRWFEGKFPFKLLSNIFQINFLSPSVAKKNWVETEWNLSVSEFCYAQILLTFYILCTEKWPGNNWLDLISRQQRFQLDFVYKNLHFALPKNFVITCWFSNKEDFLCLFKLLYVKRSIDYSINLYSRPACETLWIQQDGFDKNPRVISLGNNLDASRSSFTSHLIEERALTFEENENDKERI